MRVLGSAGALLAVVAVLAGCGEGSTSPPGLGAPVPSSPVRSGGPVRPTADPLPASDGLTVRYLDRDGQIKTLRVEDFPR